MLLFLHQSNSPVHTTPIQHQTTQRARDHSNGTAPLLTALCLSPQRRAHLSKALLRTTLLREAKATRRIMALQHRRLMVVVVLTTNETRTGTKTVIIITTTITKIMVAGAIRSTGIRTGISTEALTGEMEMRNRREVLQRL